MQQQIDAVTGYFHDNDFNSRVAEHEGQTVVYTEAVFTDNTDKVYQLKVVFDHESGQVFLKAKVDEENNRWVTLTRYSELTNAQRTDTWCLSTFANAYAPGDQDNPSVVPRLVYSASARFVEQRAEQQAEAFKQRQAKEQVVTKQQAVAKASKETKSQPKAKPTAQPKSAFGQLVDFLVRLFTGR